MLVETDAIVIGSIKYGDSSLIANCYCKELGLRSFLLKGILLPKKKGLKKSFFQPLSLISITTELKNQNNQKLHFIKQGNVRYHLNEIPLDIKKNAIALFLSEFLSIVISEEGAPNNELYKFVENGIIFLEKNPFSPFFHLKFLIELTRFLGFYPSLSNKAGEYFDMENGCFCEGSNSIYMVGGEIIPVFKKLLVINLDSIFKLNFSNSLRIKVLEFLINYFSIHLPRFRKIKSIPVLHEIFR
tara:strand:+ start:100 stop:828 length:729 start_codon:yes stop_codon:yes gene_type:complete